MPMFRNGTGSPFPTGTNPVSNATADLNGDGHLDLLFANYISDNVSVLFGNGSGGFMAGTPFRSGMARAKSKPADLDGDGDIDFIASNYSGNSVSVLLNNGNGYLHGQPRPSRSGLCQEARAGRPRRRRRSRLRECQLHIEHRLGDAQQRQRAPLRRLPDRPSRWEHVRWPSCWRSSTATTTSTLRSPATTPTPSRSCSTTALALSRPARPAATGTGPRGIAAGDLDGDGDTDLVVDNFGANTLSILLNNGSGGIHCLGRAAGDRE